MGATGNTSYLFIVLHIFELLQIPLDGDERLEISGNFSNIVSYILFLIPSDLPCFFLSTSLVTFFNVH